MTSTKRNTENIVAQEKEKKSIPLSVIIMIALVILASLSALLFNAFDGKDKGNIVFIEDTDILIDFDRDGYIDYVKYIKAEVVFGSENTNFEMGQGE
jgi:hypothetical protein